MQARNKAAPLPLVPEIERVDSLKVLGVVIQSNFSMQEHVASMCRSAAQSLYALQLFKVHGMDFQSLCTVCKALVVAKLTYASTAWWGFATNENRQSLQAVLSRATRRGFYKSSDLSIEQHCRARDLKLFSSVLLSEMRTGTLSGLGS